ncbi:unnamed protein product [Ixodes hexagonus]
MHLFSSTCTVQVSAPRDNYHGIQLSHPAATFMFLQFHFHWGGSSTRGSEHVVDDHRYSMEMHLVHINTRYRSVEDASKHDDGLAVVAVLFQAGPEDNPNFWMIINAARKIQTVENYHLNITGPVLLGRLLPRNAVDHFQYFGSLTTPPCSEAVTWVVLRQPVAISEAQLNVFRQVQAGGNGYGTPHVLMNNYRPPMPLHGRYVLRNFQCPPCHHRSNKPIHKNSQSHHQI